MAPQTEMKRRIVSTSFPQSAVFPRDFKKILKFLPRLRREQGSTLLSLWEIGRESVRGGAIVVGLNCARPPLAALDPPNRRVIATPILTASCSVITCSRITRPVGRGVGLASRRWRCRRWRWRTGFSREMCQPVPGSHPRFVFAQIAMAIVATCEFSDPG